VTVSERSAPGAAAGSGMSWHRTEEHTDTKVGKATSHGRAWLPVTAPVPRSDAAPRDDLLANRYDVIYRDGFPSRVREVA